MYLAETPQMSGICLWVTQDRPQDWSTPGSYPAVRPSLPLYLRLLGLLPEGVAQKSHYYQILNPESSCLAGIL